MKIDKKKTVPYEIKQMVREEYDCENCKYFSVCRYGEGTLDDYSSSYCTADEFAGGCAEVYNRLNNLPFDQALSEMPRVYDKLKENPLDHQDKKTKLIENLYVTVTYTVSLDHVKVTEDELRDLQSAARTIVSKPCISAYNQSNAYFFLREHISEKMADSVQYSIDEFGAFDNDEEDND